MTGLETILQQHHWTGRGCGCNCWPAIRDVKDSASLDAYSHPRRNEHRAHVADQIRGWLLSDEVCQRAERAHWEAWANAQTTTDLGRAAITAALDTTGDS